MPTEGARFSKINLELSRETRNTFYSIATHTQTWDIKWLNIILKRRNNLKKKFYKRKNKEKYLSKVSKKKEKENVKSIS